MTAGETANPGWVYHDANGRPLIGPCDTPGCPYASLPGGERHAGECAGQERCMEFTFGSNTHRCTRRATIEIYNGLERLFLCEQHSFRFPLAEPIPIGVPAS